MIDTRNKIPTDVLLEPALQARVRLLSDPDSWNTHEIEAIRADCGKDWAGIPTDTVRVQLYAMRKKGLLGTLPDSNKHFREKREQPPAWYLEYLLTEHWIAFAQIIREHWGHKCALCKLPGYDVHHNTYERLGHELMTDCILLCRSCHNAADAARKRAYIVDQANERMSKIIGGNGSAKHTET